MKLTGEVKKAIAADRANGMSVKEVAGKYGVHKSTISKYSKELEDVQVVEVPTANLEERAKVFEESPIDSPAPKSEMKTLSKFFEGVKKTEVPAVPVKRGDPAELIQKILLNADTYPDLFPNTNTESLVGRTFGELSDVLSTMEMTKSVRMLSVQMKQVFFVGCRATEVVGKSFLKLKTDGFTDGLIAQQKELDFLFKELAIKHSKKFGKATEPEIRLLMLFGIAVLQTDASNRVKERMTASTPTETTEKYSDL